MGLVMAKEGHPHHSARSIGWMPMMIAAARLAQVRTAGSGDVSASAATAPTRARSLGWRWPTVQYKLSRRKARVGHPGFCTLDYYRQHVL